MYTTALSILSLLMAAFGDWETLDSYEPDNNTCLRILLNKLSNETVWIYRDRIIYHQKKGLWYIFYKNMDTE